MADNTYLFWDRYIEKVQNSNYRDAGALQALETASLIVQQVGMVFASPNLSFTSLKLVSPISGAVITVTGSGLSVGDGEALIIEDVNFPLATGSKALVAVDLSQINNRAADNLFLGLRSGGNVYFRPDLVL